MASGPTKFTNPLEVGDEPIADGGAADISPKPPKGKTAGLQGGSVSWLKRRASYQHARNQNGQLNCKYDPQLTPKGGGMRDLGPVTYSWAFIFRMGVQDSAHEMPIKPVYQDSDPIPMEAWQLCSRMWKHNFTVDYAFSQLGDKLILMIGLPYQELVNDAAKLRIGMRLIKTKGSHGFMPEMAELYACEDPELGSPFTSAMKQTLCLHRLKTKVRIDPDSMSTHRVKKEHVLKKVQRWHDARKEIRGRQVCNLMVLFGAYRPHTDDVFGETVKRVSMLVAMDEWMVIVPDRHLGGQTPAPHEVSYADLGQCLSDLDAHNKSDKGSQEHFSGAFETFFALHDHKKLEKLRESWGNFSLVKPKLVKGPKPEYSSPYSMYHPNQATDLAHFSPFYQPIDELRDYFGDQVAMYFSWLELYTRALVWPSATGVIGMAIQVVHAESVDDNIFTIPYTLFFAAWSITFLGSWTRRENELKFLWGTEDFEIKEKPRPEFIGAHVVDPETNRDEIVYSPVRKDQILRAAKLLLSTMVSVCCILFTIYCAVEATSVKDSNKLHPAEMAEATTYEKLKYPMIASMLNLIIIQTFGVAYKAIASSLTEWENHRTQTEFEDAVISKVFLFEFVNNYFVLFYISIIRPFYHSCEKELELPAGNGTYIDTSMCMQSDLAELQFQLMVVFTGKSLGQSLAELLKPKLVLMVKKKLLEEKLVKQIMDTMDESVHSVVDSFRPMVDFDDSDDDIDTGMVQHGMTTDASSTQIANSVGLNSANGAALFDIEKREAEGAKELDEQAAAVVTAENSTRSEKKVRAALREEGLVETYNEPDSMVEAEYAMEPFVNTFGEFNAMAVQYGYLALFAPAYPLAPILALISNVFEIRIDGAKLCTVTRRPRVRQAEDIGSWFTVLNVLGFFAVITNATMLAFVGSQLGNADEKGGPCPDEGPCPAGFGMAGIAVRIMKQRLWVMAMLIEHGVMLMRLVIMRVSPNTPAWISEAKDKLDFRVSGWENSVDEMKRDGKRLETIHDALNEVKQKREKMERLLASRSVLRSTLAMLPLISAEPKSFPQEQIDMHHGIHYDGEKTQEKHFWQRSHKTHDGQKVNAKGRADAKSKKAAQMARSGAISPRSPNSSSGTPRKGDLSTPIGQSRELDTE